MSTLFKCKSSLRGIWNQVALYLKSRKSLPNLSFVRSSNSEMFIP